MHWNATMERFLKRLFRKRVPKDLPLGLNPDQVDQILSLAQHPGWAHYRQALEFLAEQQVRPLWSGLRSHEDYLFACGALETFRKILDLPQTLSQDRSPKDDRSPEPGADQFVNTPWHAIARRHFGPTG